MILTDEARLVKPCEEAGIKEGFSIIRKLELELEATTSGGMGLAANQIGILKRVCILRIPNWDNINPAVFGYNLINPIIVEKNTPAIVKNEGCLSYPGKVVETLRYNEVRVVDTLEPAGRKLTGWAAICCQHEVDHLNGITMYMRRYGKIDANDKCPCGRNSKFKKCCQKELNKTNLVME